MNVQLRTSRRRNDVFPSSVSFVADLTLGLGRVVHDYLQRPIRQSLPIGEESLAA